MAENYGPDRKGKKFPFVWFFVCLLLFPSDVLHDSCRGAGLCNVRGNMRAPLLNSGVCVGLMREGRHGESVCATKRERCMGARRRVAGGLCMGLVGVGRNEQGSPPMFCHCRNISLCRPSAVERRESFKSVREALPRC